MTKEFHEHTNFKSALDSVDNKSIGKVGTPYKEILCPYCNLPLNRHESGVWSHPQTQTSCKWWITDEGVKEGRHLKKRFDFIKGAYPGQKEMTKILEERGLL